MTQIEKREVARMLFVAREPYATIQITKGLTREQIDQVRADYTTEHGGLIEISTGHNIMDGYALDSREQLIAGYQPKHQPYYATEEEIEQHSRIRFTQ